MLSDTYIKLLETRASIKAKQQQLKLSSYGPIRKKLRHEIRLLEQDLAYLETRLAFEEDLRRHDDYNDR